MKPRHNMNKKSYQKHRNERSQRLNNESSDKANNTTTIIIFVILIGVLGYLLI